MNLTVKQIASLLNGTFEGNGDLEITGFSKIENGSSGTISYISNPLNTKFINESNASAIIINNSLILEKPIRSTLTFIRVDNPYLSITKLLGIYRKFHRNKKGIEKSSFVAPSSKIGKGCYIAPFAHIGENVKIGTNVKIYHHCFIGDNTTIDDNCIFFSRVVIYPNCVVGKNCIIHANAVIGRYDDDYILNPNNYKKTLALKNIIIEDYVEIASKICINRATIEPTVIQKCSIIR